MNPDLVNMNTINPTAMPMPMPDNTMNMMNISSSNLMSRGEMRVDDNQRSLAQIARAFLSRLKA